MDVTGNRICKLFGCRWPIQLAGMARVTTPALGAAVSEAGGLGMVAFGRVPLAVAAQTIDAVGRLTSKPVGATFIGKFLDPEAFEHAVANLPVVELFWAWPDPALVRPGVITGWQVGTVDEAKAAAGAGCSYVIAQGVEAGGHVRGTVPVLELVRKVRAAVDVPVIGAGGIGTAGDVVTVLKAGADGVRIGTRFLAATEADVHPDYLAHLVAATAEDTVLTETFSVGWPDAPHRVLADAEDAALADGPDPVATAVLGDGTVVDIRRRSTVAADPDDHGRHRRDGAVCG